MKNKFLILLILISSYLAADIAVTPTYVPRSQGRDKMRMLVGTLGWGHTDLCDIDCWYGSFAVNGGYSSSFDSDKIARCLFGSGAEKPACESCDSQGCDTCDLNEIVVQGSDVANRDPQAWLADYFYLPTGYEGSFSVRPKIQNILIDLDFYLGLDPVAEGLYMRVYTTFAHTKWTLNFCASDDVTPSFTFGDPGYFTPNGTEEFLTNLECYFSGQAPAPVEDTIFNPLQYAKMPNCCDQTKNGFAEVRLEIGWNPVQTYYSHVGFNAQLAIPTGSHLNAEYVFSPVVGNGRHWEAGGGLSAHYIFYANEDSGGHIGFYTDLSLTHIFGAFEERTFDVSGKPNSRYMLAIKLVDLVEDGLAAGQMPDISMPTNSSVLCPPKQFAREYNPVANLTTIGMSTENALQVDWVNFLNFSRGGFSFDIGYNLWVRTCEIFDTSRTTNSECPVGNTASLFDQPEEDTWALKGDARMFGYATANAGGLVIDQPVALSATESVFATIHSGTNATAPGTNPRERNLGVDSARFAYADSNMNKQQLNFAPGLSAVASDHIKTSLTPVFIGYANIERQRTRGLSHKVFGYLGYTWDRDDIAPFIGVGGFAEFGSNTEQQVGTPATESTLIATLSGECFDCSLSQWMVFLKIGASFGA